jgi:DNA-binding response OmpR family regulator
MARLSYDSVEALIYDPVSANRTATRAALYSLGFRRTETVPTLEAMVEVIQKQAPDLVLAETQGAADELCNAIQQLRQGAGYNPFIVIIVTAWEKSSALITKVVNSGADDLLLRPFSTALLGTRIEAHIERRKGFVITTDYVGPDRRRDAGRSGDIEMFDPPNSLKMKAKDRMPADLIAKKLDLELQVAREKLAGEKLRRDSFQICILWRLLREQRQGTPQFGADLTKLGNLTRSIERRCTDMGQEKVAERCAAVLAAIEGLKNGQDCETVLSSVGAAALGIHQLVCPEKSPTDQLNEIDATVAIIRARNQATALAS